MSRPWRMHAESSVTADPPPRFEEFGRQAEVRAPERDTGFRGEVVAAEAVQEGEIRQSGRCRAREVLDNA